MSSLKDGICSSSRRLFIIKPFRLIFELLFLFLLLPLIFSGQSRWVRMYLDGHDAHAIDLLVSYDGGYLLSGYMSDNLPYDCWLIKTDVNGEMLWQKTFIDRYQSVHLLGISENSSGEIYLCGLTQSYGETGNPLIVKLNACGEKEWCRAIVTEADYDYAVNICALDQGGCTITLRASTTNYAYDNVCMMNLDNEGNYMWKECYNGEDSLISVNEVRNLLHTPDGGYIITGDCRDYDDMPPYYGRRLAYIVKTDSMGQVEWELPVERTPRATNFGDGYSTTISPDGLNYYVSFERYHRDGTYGNSPALAKVDLEGNELGIFDLAPPQQYGILYETWFINDTTLAGLGLWGEDFQGYKAALISPGGEIRLERTYLEDAYEGLLRIARDKKIVILTSRRDDNSNMHPYLIKFNDQLINDTLYLLPFQYDTLCSHPVSTDTIFTDDCDVIVDIAEDDPGMNDQAMNITAWPNPFINEVTISFSASEEPDRLDFFNVYGQHLYSQEIVGNENQVTINTAAFPSGIIVAVLRSNDNRILVTKIIKL
ncbi:MAG: T9SS type A sorting domain-containing protein [Bacteroidales bacterium]|nr:T9SS type A sorting domain-containing protein [Bacteroidales bacterium]